LFVRAVIDLRGEIVLLVGNRIWCADQAAFGFIQGIINLPEQTFHFCGPASDTVKRCLNPNRALPDLDLMAGANAETLMHSLCRIPQTSP